MLGATWLALTLRGQARLAALVFLFLLPPIWVALSIRAQHVDFHQLTERRAQRLIWALDAYYAQEAQYPDALRRLSLRYLLSVSEPIIIFGQDWCYDSSKEDYQLGYVYREHWSDPRLVGVTYAASADAASTLPALCAQELRELQARAPAYYELQRR